MKTFGLLHKKYCRIITITQALHDELWISAFVLVKIQRGSWNTPTPFTLAIVWILDFTCQLCASLLPSISILTNKMYPSKYFNIRLKVNLLSPSNTRYCNFHLWKTYKTKPSIVNKRKYNWCIVLSGCFNSIVAYTQAYPPQRINLQNNQTIFVKNSINFICLCKSKLFLSLNCVTQQYFFQDFVKICNPDSIISL